MAARPDDKRPEGIGDLPDHWLRLQTWAQLRTLLASVVTLPPRERALAEDAADELAATLARERGI